MNNGGAGTIFLQAATDPSGHLLIDGEGISANAHTPLSTTNLPPLPPFNLTVTGGAAALAITELPALSNLWLGTGSVLTMSTNQTNLTLFVLNHATVESGASLNVDGKGFAPATGPGSETR